MNNTITLPAGWPILGAVLLLAHAAFGFAAREVTSTSVTRSFSFVGSPSSVSVSPGGSMSGTSVSPDGVTRHFSYRSSNGSMPFRGGSGSSSSGNGPAGMAFWPGTASGSPLGIAEGLTSGGLTVPVLDATLFSFVPRDLPGSLVVGSSASLAGSQGEISCSYSSAKRRFQVKVDARLQGASPSAQIEITPLGDDQLTQKASYTEDLSDMKARTIEIARDEDGRVYQLNMNPLFRRMESPKPRQIDALSGRLHAMAFQQSPIVLDESQFLGTILGASGDEYAFIDVPGQLRVEFALVPMREAKAAGTLQNGHLQITSDEGKKLDVYNVLCDLTGQPHPGGPYQVYVRWLPPSQSLEQARGSMKAMLERMKSYGAGAAGPGGPMLKVLESMEKGRPPISYGGGALPKSMQPDQPAK